MDTRLLSPALHEEVEEDEEGGHVVILSIGPLV